jgi:hypothetical protein
MARKKTEPANSNIGQQIDNVPPPPPSAEKPAEKPPTPAKAQGTLAFLDTAALMAQLGKYDIAPAEQHAIEQTFTYHPPQPGQPARYEALRAKARELAYLMTALCPYGRERATAMTHLQTAVMYANAAIALEPPPTPAGPAAGE